MPNEQTNGFLKPEEKEFQAVYKRGLWWIEHRALIKNALLALLALFDAALLLFAGWQFLDAFVLSRPLEDRNVAVLADSSQGERRDFVLSLAAEPLTIDAVQAVASGDGENYDLYVMVANNNSDWFATFKYAFKLKDSETAPAEGFILPNEKRPLVSFEATTSKPTDLDLVLRDVEWHRVDSRLIEDYEQWFLEHAVTITDAAFSRGDDSAPPEISFLAKNFTAYNYWQPIFLAVLWRGSSPVGLARITVSELESGEEKNLSSRWLGPVPAVSKVEIFSEINFLDPSVYSSLESSPSGDVRTRFKTR